MLRRCAIIQFTFIDPAIIRMVTDTITTARKTGVGITLTSGTTTKTITTTTTISEGVRKDVEAAVTTI